MSCLPFPLPTRNGHLHLAADLSLAHSFCARSYNKAIRRARQISGYAVTRLYVRARGEREIALSLSLSLSLSMGVMRVSAVCTMVRADGLDRSTNHPTCPPALIRPSVRVRPRFEAKREKKRGNYFLRHQS